MKIIKSILICSLLISNLLYSQNITNTLGTNGVFGIKDNSVTYLTLNQNTGILSLNGNLNMQVSTSSSLGVILKGSNSFIHDYQAPGTVGRNTFVGFNSGNFTMSGIGGFASNNTGVGYLTLNSLTSGNNNSAFGSDALQYNSTGNNNNAFGIDALINNQSGRENAAFGTASLRGNISGNYNSAFGSYTLGNGSGYNNCAFGYFSLYVNTGNNNSAFGFNSLMNNVASLNSAFGYQSLFSNTSGSYNSAFGANALRQNTTSSFNSAFGHSSLYNNTSGQENSAFGFESLVYNNTGFENTAVGYRCLFLNTSGWHNTAVGDSALYSNTGGWQNTAVGHHSLTNNTGNYNTAIGYNSGSQVTSGLNLTLIGIDANPSSPTASDQITLGNGFVSSLRCNVTTITSLSDARDKKNIKDLPLGLDFIVKLKPRQYNWDKREWYENNLSDGSKMQETPTAGFIAQELDEVQTSENAQWLNLVLKDNPEKWEATPGNLLPIIVKAVQELNQKCEILQNENQNLLSELQFIKEINEKLVKLEETQNELIKIIKSCGEYTNYSVNK